MLFRSTDAVALVVSEETGHITLVEGGILMRKLNKDKLTLLLSQFLSDYERPDKSR